MPETYERRFPGGLLLIDDEGRILDAPRFFRDVLEFELDSEVTVFELFSVKRRPRLTINRVVANEDEREYHVTVQRENADPLGFRYWDVTSGPGNPIAFFVVDDTSVIKSHEWRLKRLRRSFLNDAEDFIASELTQQLATLTVLAEVLRDEPEPSAETADRLMGTIEQLNAVVAEFAGHFKESDAPPETEVRVVDLPTVVASWSDKMVKVECRSTKLDNSWRIPSVVVERILFPLVTNAIESRPKDGTVRVVIKPLDNRVSFEISDKGRGMTKHELSRAEDPFFTTKRGHAGLGLSSARDALRQVEGYWNYTSSRKRGTRVRVVIPCE